MTTETESTVITISEGEESTEIIAESIERVAAASEKLLASGLSRRALLVLLKDRTGLNFMDINAVLNALPELRTFLA